MTASWGWPWLKVDREADAAYVELTAKRRVARTVELDYGINVDLDDEGLPIGYEILSLRGDLNV